MKKTKYCCSVCKGTNVQVLAWVDANTNKFVTDYQDDGECWCEDCDELTSLEETKE